MHYRHSFHAGNFADIFKHTLLIGLVQALQRKDKPWFFLDTHAGAGRYALLGGDAQRTSEWEDGVGRLRELKNAPAPLSTLLELARRHSPSLKAVYPGSPLLAAMLAGPADRLVFCEKIEAICAQLDTLIHETASAAKTAVHQRDGYEAAIGLLPPAEKRGLVLIDPPFERLDEFDAASDCVLKSQARFAGGIYAVWYPVKKRFDADRFLRRLGRDSVKPVLDLRFDTGAHAEGQMRACGVVIVNPPFHFAEDMQPALEAIRVALAQGPKSRIDTAWIKTEEQCLK